MMYNQEVNGVELHRECYAFQLAEPGDLKFNYSVYIYGECIDEGENPKELAHSLLKTADRLVKIANFLKRKKK